MNHIRNPVEHVREFYQYVNKELNEYIRIKQEFDAISEEYMNKKACLDTLRNYAKESEKELLGRMYDLLEQESKRVLESKIHMEHCRDTIEQHRVTVRESMRELLSSYWAIDRAFDSSIPTGNDTLIVQVGQVVYPTHNRQLRSDPPMSFDIMEDRCVSAPVPSSPSSSCTNESKTITTNCAPSPI